MNDLDEEILAKEDEEKAYEKGRNERLSGGMASSTWYEN